MRPGHRSLIFALLALGCRDAASPPPPRSPDRVDVARTHLEPACNVSWKDPVSGSWGDKTMWDLGRVPHSYDLVCITTPGSYTVLVDRGNALSLVVGDGSSTINLAGMTFQTSTPQVTCSAPTGPLACTVGALAAGASVEFVLVFRAGAAGSYTNDASITGNEYDPVITNNVVVWNVTVN